MSCNNVLGLILANSNEMNLPQLTAYRTTGSVPFGGKFRLVDFMLSSMSNSGINNVGIVIKSNFQSLMDHLGSGAAWDLDHRRSGLKILPPYDNTSFGSIVESLHAIHGYLEESKEEYVLITPSDIVQNIDFNKVLDFHLEKNSDVTFVYVERNIESIRSNFRCLLDLDENSKVTAVKTFPPKEGTYNLTTGAVLVKKDALLLAVKQAVAESKYNFIKDVIQSNIDKINAYAYKEEGFCEFITSLNDYYKVNMMLFDKSVRDELFNKERPIYTKIRDDSPSKYGLNSKVTGSLIAQGCIIEGTVENSIISKGVYIGKNAKVSNSIVMQDSIINDGCDLSCIIVDKDVVISKDKSLSGSDTYPMYIAKRTEV